MKVRLLVWVLAGLAGSASLPRAARQGAAPAGSAGRSAELLERVWRGVQQAQTKYFNGCGTLTERRTSRLLSRPLLFRGRFCAAGLTKFHLEYLEPQPLRITFNQDYLNVTTAGGRTTEVFKIGSHVRRTQTYFSSPESIHRLREDFDITVTEEPGDFVLRLVARSERFKRRVNYVVVRLRRQDFLLRSLEIDGRSGVNSLFSVSVDKLNSKLDDGLFKVYRP